MFWVKVKQDQKALMFKDEKFIKVLNVGKHKIFHLFGGIRIERYPLKEHSISGEMAYNLYKQFPKETEANFNVVALKDNKRAFVKADGHLIDFLHPAEVRLYWKELDIEVIEIDVFENFRANEDEAKLLELFSILPKDVAKYKIPEQYKGYLFVNSKFEEVLESGKYFFYTNYNEVEVKLVDCKVNELEVNSQELLTNDKVTIRCNLTAHYKVVDGIKFLQSVSEPTAYIYKQLQFAAREHFGKLNIDEVLSNQHTFSDEIKDNFIKKCQELGVEVEGIYIKDIILPGEMREIFNQVIQATKKAEANNIKRREETAATRSLLNTAKLMKDNPTLQRLKELETLEKITTQIDTLNVYGGLEKVMNGLVKID